MATYYVTTTGAGGHTGADEANAFTMEEACDNVAASDKVWVKADANYTAEYDTGGAKDCVMYIVTDGASGGIIVWQGYKTNIGDGGIVTIDANTNTLASAAIAGTGLDWNVFKNFVFSGGSGIGFAGGSDNAAVFKNCRFTNNGTHGMDGGVLFAFENCLIDNNGTTTSHRGIDTGDRCAAVACVAYANSGPGILFTGDGICVFCLAYNNGAIQNLYVGSSEPHAGFVNCTIDGENQVGSVGVYLGGTWGMCINTIVHDLAIGISSVSDQDELKIARNNLFNSNTADVNNFLAVSPGDGVGDRGDVEAAPGFTNEANDDYTLSGDGAADAAGFDAKFTDDFWDSFIAANNPPTP